MSTEVTSPTFGSQLKEREEVAERTIAYRFEKPANWTVEAGQFIDMTLLNPSETDAEGNARTFSIASGPHEKDLMVTTRIRNTAFKRVLKTLPIGTTVRIDGPFGDLTLPHNTGRALVFLAGGIGITPFRSMLIWAARREAATSYFPLLFKPAAGGCSVPRRAPNIGEREPKLQVYRHHDGNGEITPALARRDSFD